MENKKSLLIILMLIISAHLLLFANLVVEEKIVVVENKPSINISKINLKNVVIKKCAKCIFFFVVNLKLILS